MHAYRDTALEKPEDKFWGKQNRFIYCCNAQQKSHFLVVNIAAIVFICLIKQRLYVERQLKSFHLFAQTEIQRQKLRDTDNTNAHTPRYVWNYW